MNLRFPERTLSLACFVGLLAAMLHWDPRVRVRLQSLGQEASHLAGSYFADSATTAGGAIVSALLDQSISHAPLLIFGIAAAVLVIFMARM